MRLKNKVAMVTGGGHGIGRVYCRALAKEKATATRCLKRVKTPEDLVGTMVYLSSGDSDFMTGETVVVDVGNVMV